MLCLLHSVTLQMSKKLLCNESMLLEKKPVGSYFMQLQISILHCQQKQLEHKIGQRQHHDAWFVAAAIGKKACLVTKQHRAVKKSSPWLFPLLSYAWLKESVSQLVENSAK